MPEEPEHISNPPPPFTEYSFWNITHGHPAGLTGIEVIKYWKQTSKEAGVYGFELPRSTAQTRKIRVTMENGKSLEMLNFSSYNYLGYATHPEVISAAKEALDTYGLGASNPPVISGTLTIHQQLEQTITSNMGLPGKGVSLFTSGYCACLGSLSALFGEQDAIILDRHAHRSLKDGALLSGARTFTFFHNHIPHLERILKQCLEFKSRVVCIDSVYSTEGNFARLAEITDLCKKYDAKLLVDEAHSFLLTGPEGRGFCAEQGLMEKVDFMIITFSKSAGGIGGALYAEKDIAEYVNWAASSRMFSCAMDPAVTGGMIKSLELGFSADGAARRKILSRNTALLINRLRGEVDIGTTESWIIPVIIGEEGRTQPIHTWLQENGLDTGLIRYPGVPKDAARLRLFISSEHTEEDVNTAADLLLQAADKFGFRKDP